MPLNTELLKYGLNQKEADVYLALMELSSATVQQIAQKSGVNRATSYLILDGLREKGLVSIFEKERRTYYAAENPHSLENLLASQEREFRQKREELKNIMPDLMGVFNASSHKPVVRYYEGENAAKSMGEEFWSGELKEDRAFISYKLIKSVSQSSHTGYEIFLTRIDWLKKKIAEGLDLRMIVSITDEAKKNMSELEKKYYDVVSPCFVNEKDFPVTGEISIMNGKILIERDYGGLTMGIMIFDKFIFENYQSLFDLAWSFCQLNKK